MSGPTALAEAGRIDAELARQIEWARDSYRRGVEDGIEIGRRQTLAEEAAQRREAAGLVRSAMRDCAIERDRWTLRGERRTRQLFSAPHAADYPGRGAA